MQIAVRIPLLDRLVDRPQQDLQPLQTVGHGTRCQVQVSQPPGSQEAFGGPIGEILVQKELDPYGSAVQAFGNQFGNRSSGEGTVALAGAGPLIASPANHAAMGTHVDLDLFGVFGVTPEAQRLTAVGADT